MPRDISPSSSEDEADSPASTEQPMETNSKCTRNQIIRTVANIDRLDGIVAVCFDMQSRRLESDKPQYRTYYKRCA